MYTYSKEKILHKISIPTFYNCSFYYIHMYKSNSDVITYVYIYLMYIDPFLTLVSSMNFLK